MSEDYLSGAAAQSEFTEKEIPVYQPSLARGERREARARIEEMRRNILRCPAQLLVLSFCVKAAYCATATTENPKGLLGQPMLNVFQRRAISNVCCVVTRYCWAQGADAGLYRGVRCCCCRTQPGVPVGRGRRFACPMGCFEQVRLLCDASGGIIEHTDYGADVTLDLLLPQGGRMALQDKLIELSAGTLTLEAVGEEYRGGPREELT